MTELTVALGNRSYPIHIGAGLLGDARYLTPHIAGRQVMLVTDETVAPLYLQRALASLRDFECAQVVLADGEQYKNLDTVERVFEALLTHRFNRTATLVALGGGVIGDITGFAAACYQRGVPFIQMPTTLLAQVDSSVGGKTGVNHALGKNMIGAFHQPRCVIADTTTLDTLDDRQLRAGIAEVIKYGLISDPDFFAWLEQHMQELLARQPEALAYAIERSCRNKAEVVAADELETGRRALLNLGHTFGHAIETGTGYGTWLHGEAVAAGMCMAAELSAQLGWISAADVARTEALMLAAGLPARPPTNLSRERFLELIAIDKKVLDGRLRLVLLKGIGRAVVTDDFDNSALHQVLDAASGASATHAAKS